MHIPIPFAGVARSLRRAYSYFRTGVAIEGGAWLCDRDHVPMVKVGNRFVRDTVAQHIDVELRFWNRRGGRVTVLEIAEMKLLSRTVELVVASWEPFKSVTLEEGSDRETRRFVLVPKSDPNGRVELGVGEVLELRFLPSRGSERWARPRIRLQIGVRS